MPALLTRWRYVIRQGWILARTETVGTLRNFRALRSFYLQFLIISVIMLLPIYLFNNRTGSLFVAGYLAGLTNAMSAQQFSGRVIGRVESGEYEVYLLSPLPLMSVYMANVFSLLLMLPIVAVIYALAVLTIPGAQANPVMFLAALLLTLVLNTGVSIFLAGVHLAYRSLNQISSIVGVVIMLYCMIGVLPLYSSSLQPVTQFVPWTHSTLLILQSVQNTIPPQQIALSAGVILAITLISTPLALRFYALAEKKRKRNGFIAEARPI